MDAELLLAIQSRIDCNLQQRNVRLKGHVRTTVPLVQIGMWTQAHPLSSYLHILCNYCTIGIYLLAIRLRLLGNCAILFLNLEISLNTFIISKYNINTKSGFYPVLSRVDLVESLISMLIYFRKRLKYHFKVFYRP